MGTRFITIPVYWYSTFIFRTDIPVNHPLRTLLDASLSSIIQAVPPRTLQSYLTAWNNTFSFTKVTTCLSPFFPCSFISPLNAIKNPQASSRRSLYLYFPPISASHCRSRACSRRSPYLYFPLPQHSHSLFRCRSNVLLQVTYSTPPTLSSASFGELSMTHSGCCPTLIASLGGALWVSAKC